MLGKADGKAPRREVIPRAPALIGLSLSLSLSAGVKERGRCFSSSDSREERSLESVSDDKSDSDRPGEVHMPG